MTDDEHCLKAAAGMEVAVVLRRDGTMAAVVNSEVVDVTNLIDEDGDDTDEWETAVCVVAGPDKNGQWWNIKLPGNLGDAVEAAQKRRYLN